MSIIIPIQTQVYICWYYVVYTQTENETKKQSIRTKKKKENAFRCCILEFCIFLIVGASTPAVTYDYGYGRTTQTYDASKTYYQQASTTATYAAAAQTYDASQTAAKVSLTSFCFGFKFK